MKQKTRQRLIIAALPVAVIWAAFNMEWREDKKAPSAPAATAPVRPAPPAPETVTGQVDVAHYQELPWSQDPFRLPESSKKARAPVEESRWVVSGIVHSTEDPMAVVNNRRVRTGDKVDNATVIEITKEHVRLDYRGKRITLTVAKG